MSLSLAPKITFLFFMALGALHVLGPDHWMPTSVLAWQKRWNFSKTIGFSTGAFFFHVLAGYLVFLLFQKWAQPLTSAHLFLFALILMLVIMVLRGARFSKVKNVFRLGKLGARGNFAVLSFLGPCEIAVPLFAKAKILGIGYLVPFMAILLGTWIAGICMVVWGQLSWDRPWSFPRGMQWVHRRRAVLPMFVGLMLNLGFVYFC